MALALMAAALTLALAAATVLPHELRYLLLLGIALVALAACGLLAWLRSGDRSDLALSRWLLGETAADLHAQQEMLAIASEIGRFGGWRHQVGDPGVRWSDEVARIHGKEPGYSPTSVEEGIAFYAPEFRDRIATAFGRCLADGTPFDEELQIIRADGERVWVNALGRAVRGPDGPDGEPGPVVGVNGGFQDISARKEAELAALESARRLTSLADAMPLLVWASDPYGRIEYTSRGLLDYTGVPADRLHGDAWTSVVHPDDRAETLAHWDRSLANGTPYSVEFRIRRYDGTYRWHLNTATPHRAEDGTIRSWWGASIDVHDTKELEATSRRLAERLSDTLESIGDAVLGLDREWRVTVVNQHAEQLLQATRAQLVGRNIWELFPEAVGSVFQTSYEQAVAERRPVRFGAPFAPLDIYAEVSAYPHDDGLTIYFRDITEQRAMEEQLAHAQRLESLGQLTGGVAHDFNNLLTVMLGNAEILNSALADQPRLQSLAGSISGVARRGAELTRDLLAFARRQPLDPTAVDVVELVASVEPLLRRTFGSTIVLRCSTGTGLPPVRADRGQLENALLNLCLNARDALPLGGRITVEARETLFEEADPARPADLAPGVYVTLTVTDDGVGIAPKDLDRVFEPFFTTKAAGKGTGLGLAMVYGFAKQSGGHVGVRSAPGNGTTFALHLPLHPDVPEAAPRDRAPERAVGLPQPLTVLLVERDEQVREVAHQHLRTLGYQVVEARDQASALAVLGDGGPVDVLLTDVALPGDLTGPQLAARAREHHPDLLVLFTSASGEGPRLLRKPYGRTELAEHLRTLLQGTAGAVAR